MKRQSYKKGPRFGPEACGYIEDLKPVQKIEKKLHEVVTAPLPTPVMVVETQLPPVVPAAVENQDAMSTQQDEVEPTAPVMQEQEVANNETSSQNTLNLRDKKKK